MIFPNTFHAESQPPQIIIRATLQQHSTALLRFGDHYHCCQTFQENCDT